MAEKDKWMQEANEKMDEKGTKGTFTRSAKRAGKSVAEYAREKKHAKGKLGRRARFALNARKANRGGKR
jgi:hypothetical protein